MSAKVKALLQKINFVETDMEIGRASCRERV